MCSILCDEEVMRPAYESAFSPDAAEAAIVCREYAFTVLDADSVCSMIRDTNIASQNVAVRNGMKIIDKAAKNFRNTEMNFFYILQNGHNDFESSAFKLFFRL